MAAAPEMKSRRRVLLQDRRQVVVHLDCCICLALCYCINNRFPFHSTCTRICGGFCLDEKTLELFNRSFESCVARLGFLERFYAIFVGSSPEVRDKFKHTDLRTQAQIVKKSLYILTMASCETEEVREEIARVGWSHGREGMKIGMDMYDLWLGCLLQAVREFDPRWSQEVGEIWRQMLGPYISRLKEYS